MRKHVLSKHGRLDRLGAPRMHQVLSKCWACSTSVHMHMSTAGDRPRMVVQAWPGARGKATTCEMNLHNMCDRSRGLTCAAVVLSTITPVMTSQYPGLHSLFEAGGGCSTALPMHDKVG